MEYINKEKESYNLHLIKTDKFKTITIRICFKNKIEKEEITLRNFLVSFLTNSTDTYKTKRELVLKCDDLYAADVYARPTRIGKTNIINFSLSLLEEKYTEKGMLEESVKFFSDIVFNPNFDDVESFKSNYDFLYKKISKNISNYKENKSGYSSLRMLEEMANNEPFGYRGIGYLEDLEKITKSDLIDYYNKLINDSYIDIYVLGNNIDNVEELLDKYFKFNGKRKNIDSIIECNKLPTGIKEIKEEDNNNQSKLVIGCRIKDLNTFERNYVLSIYNMILGSTSESKLFQVIREKNSLAYYANSGLNKLDNIMTIRAGIALENYDKVIELVKSLMKEMQEGKFTEEDINIAKEHYIAVVKEIEDSSDAIIDACFVEELICLESLDERCKKVLEVTKEDIINVSQKIAIDTIFLLAGIGGQ